MRCHCQVAGFILAGGASSRVGRDKGLLDFGAAPLIVHTARLLQPLVAEVTVVGPRRAEGDTQGMPSGPDRQRLFGC